MRVGVGLGLGLDDALALTDADAEVGAGVVGLGDAADATMVMSSTRRPDWAETSCATTLRSMCPPVEVETWESWTLVQAPGTAVNRDFEIVTTPREETSRTRSRPSREPEAERTDAVTV
ncbi:MAG: hypothetical protein R2731_03660 [Nocardioides sp.]